MNIYELRTKVTVKLQELAICMRDEEVTHKLYDEAVDLVIVYLGTVIGQPYNEEIKQLCIKIKAAEPLVKWYG